MFADINIYPIPAREKVNICFSDDQANIECTIRIHSLDGKLLYGSGTIKSEGTFSIQLNDLPDGIYVLSIEIDKKTLYSKLVVNE